MRGRERDHLGRRLSLERLRVVHDERVLRQRDDAGSDRRARERDE
jgi:hypothetical protein